jgi:hypothetical protein
LLPVMIPSSLARHPLAPGSSLLNKLNTMHPKSTIWKGLLPFHHCFTNGYLVFWNLHG